MVRAVVCRARGPGLDSISIQINKRTFSFSVKAIINFYVTIKPLIGARKNAVGFVLPRKNNSFRNLIFFAQNAKTCKNLHHSISQNVRRVFECEVKHENAKWGKEEGITFPSKASSLPAGSACLGRTAWLGLVWFGLHNK